MFEKSFHRRSLPHLYFNEGIYFITYRLANSSPAKKVVKVKAAFRKRKQQDDNNFKKLFKEYDSILDSFNYGVKYLSIPGVADICKYTLHYADKKDYKLICYCVMPNHIHLVFELLCGNKGISKIMQSIKRISGRKGNLVLKRTGKFWQDESYDRLVRDDKELYFIIKYVMMNPVNAGLANDWRDWKHSYCHPDFLALY